MYIHIRITIFSKGGFLFDFSDWCFVGFFFFLLKCPYQHKTMGRKAHIKKPSVTQQQGEFPVLELFDGERAKLCIIQTR